MRHSLSTCGHFMKQYLAATVFCCVLINLMHAERQIISIKLIVNEIDGRKNSKLSSNVLDGGILVDLASKLREIGLQPADYMFNMLFHDTESYNSLTQVRLNRTNGVVEPPLNGFDREVVCDQRHNSNVCIDKYIIQVDAKNNDFKHRDTISFDLQITINDINDHDPMFQLAKFSKNLKEDASAGSLVSLPSAFDGDGKYAVRSYDLIHTDNSFDFFAVEIKSRNNEFVPYLRILKALDYEQTMKFQMTLIAMDIDRHKGELILEINVIDVNDNKPTWSDNSKDTVVVSECSNHRDHDFILQFNATDLDRGNFGMINYKLSDSNPPQVLKTFHIVEKKLQLSKALDYEGKELDNPIMIEVDARDGGGLISSNVFTIKVTDCNDNTPVLTVSYVNKSVTENDAVEKLIARVVVTDRDSGDNGRVDCSLDDNTKLQMLEDSREKSQAGILVIYKVWTKISALFDRESQNTFQSQVTCSDHGFNSRKGVANILLNVLDQNDNAPFFQNRVYEFRINENLPSNTPIGPSIVATDQDIGINGQLSYSLDEPGNKYFSLKIVDDQRKSIRLLSKFEFDREQRSNYTFLLIAQDNGQPSQSTTATIIVHIEDVNDNPPTFQLDVPYVFNVTETVCRIYCNYQTMYIGQVQAKDRDTGTSISYKLGFSSKYPYELNASILSHFRIESSTGKIYAKKVLDRELETTWHLEVIAQDSREPYYSSTAIVTVRIMDINDNRPTFLFPTAANQTLKIDETAVSGSLLGYIKAIDPDAGENGTVRYKFVNNNNESTAMSYFQLDSHTGAITLLQRLDKYKLSHINLLVMAEDNGNPSTRSHLAILKIVIRQQRGHTYIAQNNHNARSNSYPREEAPNQENSLLPLLLLCGVVFLVFASLLAIIVYMYSRGYIRSTCAPCFQERSACKEKEVVNPDAMRIEAADWTVNVEKNDSSTASITESNTTPHTLRRYHWQAVADDKQRHKISHIDEGVNAQGLNTQTKSISYAYIPVACDDRFMYSTHKQSLEKGHLAATNTIGAYQTINAGITGRANKQHKAIINQKLANGYKSSSAHHMSNVELVQSSYPNHHLYDPIKEMCPDQTQSLEHHSPNESVSGHAYTILDENKCQPQIRQPMMHIYTDANEQTSIEAVFPNHNKQIKTPYITSSFV